MGMRGGGSGNRSGAKHAGQKQPYSPNYTGQNGTSQKSNSRLSISTSHPNLRNDYMNHSSTPFASQTPQSMLSPESPRLTDAGFSTQYGASASSRGGYSESELEERNWYVSAQAIDSDSGDENDLREQGEEREALVAEIRRKSSAEVQALLDEGSAGQGNGYGVQARSSSGDALNEKK